jgi:hypothetical protein
MVYIIVNSINCNKYFYNIGIDQWFVPKRGGWRTLLVCNVCIIDHWLELKKEKKNYS